MQALTRSHTRETVETLAGIMDDADAPPAARVRAAEVLLDRGCGKRMQAITPTMALPSERAEDLTDEELAAIFAAGGGLAIRKDNPGVH